MATALPAPPMTAGKSVSPAWARFRDAFRRHPMALVGGAILAAMALVAIVAPWPATLDPQAGPPARRLRPPSAAHEFGTDMLGRGAYGRGVYGARVSLIVGLAVAVVSTLLGVAI